MFLPLLATIFGAPLLQDVFLHFLTDPEQIRAGSMGFAMRLGWFCCAVMALRSYTALVRGPERAVLDPHPGDPKLLLRYLTLRCASENLVLLCCGIAMLWPLAWAGYSAEAAVAACVVATGWALGLLIGFPVHLAAVWAAESRALSNVLEALRGANPRLQAALIYAPGVVLALGGAGVWMASQAGLLLLADTPSGWGFLLGPVVLGALAWGLAGPLAGGFHYKTTMVLAEIDAHYARLEDAEEGKIVYLQWMVRFFPQSLQPHLLKDLRHGWRGLRTWVLGAWAAGVMVGLSSVSDDPQAFERSLALAGAALVAVASTGLWLGIRDPKWLDTSLPAHPQERLRARSVAVFLWLQGVLLLGAIGLGWRHGSSEAWVFLAVLEGLAVVLAVGASRASRWREQGWSAYLPGALLLWAGCLGVLT
ncbi:MAG: hypothetical protein VXW32_12090 [Myxococcota bacterium]|nr:hypothetical protein [Myxococcota bacterium]